MIDYARGGAICTIKKYKKVRLIPDKKMSEFGIAKLHSKTKKRYVSYVNGKPVTLASRIYKKHHGPIPDGYEIHHVDGDRFNDDISNLVAISHEEHVELHKKMRIAHQAVQIVHITKKEAKEMYENGIQ